nr:MAG TPA: PD-(D/E)XK nuclease superfamily protein [Caudoviricetes sp.]
MPKHAYLSASASHRWLACPPSAKLCANIADQTSEYAQQGTDCHELCAYLVEKALGRAVTDPTENLTFYDAEMQICAEEYRNYVLEQIEAAKEFCKDPQVMIEQRLDFSRWVENGFGTGDCVIVADEVLQIIDYKHGLGVLVSAGDEEHGGNSQMMCYALGALEAFGDIYDINQIKMTIFQPRRDNVSTYTISKDDLLKWAEEVLAPTAQLAYTGKGEFKAGDHCQFCKVKATCRKRAEYNLELAKYDFEMPATLDDIEIAAILAKVDEMISWGNDIKEYALQQAQSGVHFDGWKIVEGKSNRKFTDEAAVVFKVKDAGYDPYEKKLLGITAMSTMLGKKKFEELLGELVYKPPGKPTLVPESDKRPAMNTAIDNFSV